MAIGTYDPIPEEYQPGVDEVVRFVTEGQILSRPFQPERFCDYPCEVVYEIADWTPYRVAGLPESKCEEEWQDVRISTESEHMELRKLSAKKYPVIRSAEFSEKLNEIYFFLRPKIESQLKDALPKADPIDDIKEIELHIDLAIQSRAKVGVRHANLSQEILFNVYKAFGYPCGWIGPFPGGKLVVFSVR